MKMAMCAWL